MIFGASIPYLLVTLALIGLGHYFNRPVTRDVSIGLLIWTVGIVAVYDRGELDQIDRAIVALAFMPVCVYLVLRHDHHWLTLFLLVANLAQFFWALVFNAEWYRYADDPKEEAAYAIKYVGNLIFLWDQLAAAVSLVPWGALWLKIRRT